VVGGEEPGVEEAAELVDGQLDQALWRRVVAALGGGGHVEEGVGGLGQGWSTGARRSSVGLGAGRGR